MFLIDKKISVDKPLTLRSITKYDNVFLQSTTARLITGASRRRAPVLKCRRFLSFFQRYIVRDISLTEIYRWLVTLARSLKSYPPF